MIRRWLVEPDESGIVTETQLVGELSRAAMILDKMGGHLRVTTHRQRSADVPGEAFTVGAMIEWVDRTDDARPAPEQESPAPRAAAPAPEEPGDVADVLADSPHLSALLGGDDDDQAAAAREAYAAEERAADEDGIVRGADGEPEEDLTSIPAGLR